MGKNTTVTGGELDDDVTDDTTDDDVTDDQDTDDGDDTDTDDAGDDEEDEEDEDAVLASMTPAQRKIYDAKITKANNNGKLWRMRATGKDQNWKRTPTPGDVPPRKTATNGNGKDTDKIDPAEMRRQIAEELRQEQAAARAAERVLTTAQQELIDAGLVLPKDRADREAKLKRVLRMLDLDGLEPRDVAHEVDDLRRTSPELFTVRRRAGRKGGVVGPAPSAPSRPRAGQAPKNIAEIFE
jgi:hypothetical protein